MPPVHIERVTRVLRVSTNETGMRTAIAIAMKHQDDPYAPKVYETMELRDGFACIMEKLDECRWRDTYSPIGDLHDKGFRKSDREFDSYKVVPNDWLIENSPFVAELQAVVDKHSDFRYDLHSRNFAMRGEQLVILDPLYCERMTGPLPEYGGRDPNRDRREVPINWALHTDFRPIEPFLLQAMQINMRTDKMRRLHFNTPRHAAEQNRLGLDRLPKA